MSENQVFKGTVVTGVIGDDVHVVGIRILEHALKHAGFKVVPLGVQVSQEDFINAAIETRADAILVSSLSGHAQMLVPGLRAKCIEAGLKDILLYLGGQLVIGRTPWEQVESKYREMGLDYVCPPNVMPAQVVQRLEADLSTRRK
ncbi:MAG: methylaspartate mutase subunit S [Dehalococcoidales bacterium]|nr:methylaspartate mutase subunit S [Dehalococcoidales bacterium]